MEDEIISVYRIFREGQEYSILTDNNSELIELLGLLNKDSKADLSTIEIPRKQYDNLPEA